jgi:uncharacterized membrane protein
MTPDNTGSPPPLISDGRLISLSDGVFAFAMTLMVITLDVPRPDAVTIDELPRTVQKQWPEFFSYLVTFWVIATFWFVHRRLFREIINEDTVVGWLSILFLFCIVFLPYPSDMMGNFPESQFALVFYAGTMAATSFVLSALSEYSRSRGLFMKDLPTNVYREGRFRSVLVAGVMLVSIGISFYSLDAARFSWLLILVGEAAIRRSSHKSFSLR